MHQQTEFGGGGEKHHCRYNPWKNIMDQNPNLKTLHSHQCLPSRQQLVRGSQGSPGTALFQFLEAPCSGKTPHFLSSSVLPQNLKKYSWFELLNFRFLSGLSQHFKVYIGVWAFSFKSLKDPILDWAWNEHKLLKQGIWGFLSVKL